MQVKLIKCLVDNIVVDVSFNQVGGLCTLCYLEEVGMDFDSDVEFVELILKTSVCTSSIFS